MQAIGHAFDESPCCKSFRLMPFTGFTLLVCKYHHTSHDLGVDKQVGIIISTLIMTLLVKQVSLVV